MHRRQRTSILGLSLVLLGGAFALKWWYRDATVDDLWFVLRPVATVVGLLSGEPWTLVVGEGYVFPGLHMLIDRSCSGINFLVIATASFAFLLLHRADAGCAAPLLALLSTGGAYLLTVLVNSGRILTLIGLQRLELPISPVMHEAIGAFYFLAGLMLATLLFDRHLRPPPPTHAQAT
jgi:exosortase K